MSNYSASSGPESCCGAASDPLGSEQAGEAAAIFKVLADPVRLRLLALISARTTRDGVCVCELVGCFDLSQPTISHHLKVLRTAGLVDGERRGTWVYYWPVPGAVDRARIVLDGLSPSVQATPTGTGAGGDGFDQTPSGSSRDRSARSSAPVLPA